MSEACLFLNGTIRFSADPGGCAEGLLVGEGKIQGIGRVEDLRNQAGPGIEEVDLAGKVLVPSFRDCLGSLRRESLAGAQLDLSTEASIPEVFAMVERFAKALPQDRWIVGFGWNKGQWGWKRFPHRADLDLVSPHHPVVLFSADQRVAWLNSAALSHLDIHLGTPNPPGGEIHRDESTRAATGILKEKAIELILPKIPEPNPNRLRESLNTTLKKYLQRGITEVHSHDCRRGWDLVAGMEAEQGLPLRVVSYIQFEDWQGGNLEDRRLNGTEARHEFGGVWFHVDGTLASQTAWTREPYLDDWNHFGMVLAGEKEIADRLRSCFARGTAPRLFASGDAACGAILDALEGLEHRAPVAIVHGDLVRDEEYERLGRLGCSLITNPCRIQTEHVVGRMNWGDRWNRALALSKWAEHASPPMFGSGEPLNLWSPLAAMQAAVSSRPDCPHPPLSRKDALAALVRTSRGISPSSCDTLLETGMAADLAILSEDPLEVPIDQIGKIEVLATLFQGEWAFQAKEQIA